MHIRVLSVFSIFGSYFRLDNNGPDPDRSGDIFSLSVFETDVFFFLLCFLSLFSFHFSLLTFQSFSIQHPPSTIHPPPAEQEIVKCQPPSQLTTFTAVAFTLQYRIEFSCGWLGY